MSLRPCPIVLLGALVLLSAVACGQEWTATEAAPAAREAETAATVTVVTSGWVDVREMLDTIASGQKLGLQVAPDVTGKVKLHLRDVPLGQALESMLSPLGCDFTVIDGILSVSRAGLVTRWFHFDYPVTTREGKDALQVSGSAQSESGSSSSSSGENKNESQVTSASIMAVWPQVIAALQAVILPASQTNFGADVSGIALSDGEGRHLVVDPMAGLVQVTAEAARVETAAGLLRRLDESLGRQVAIEVRILEIQHTKGEESGVDWSLFADEDASASLTSTPGLTNPVLDFVVDDGDISGLMQMISTSGNVEVLSSPHITTLNNQKAVVRVVTEEVFFAAQVEPAIVSNGVATEPVVEYEPRIIPVGVVLDVTPQIGSDGTVTLNVHPTISNIVRVETSPNDDTQPVISVRELATVGQVGDGQTMVIAGLIAEYTSEERAGVPILKDIPLLGYLFRKRELSTTEIELVMLLTPTILDAERITELALDSERRFD